MSPASALLIISRRLSLVECWLDFSLEAAVRDRVIFTVGGDMIAIVQTCDLFRDEDLQHVLDHIPSAGNVI